MVFNIITHNRDDHAKNFAFIMDETGQWSLAPAYDLTYAPGSGGEHTTTIFGEGRHPTKEHCQKLGQQFDLKDRDIKAIIDQVNQACTTWPNLAKQAGCTKKVINTISNAIITL